MEQRLKVYVFTPYTWLIKCIKVFLVTHYGKTYNTIEVVTMETEHITLRSANLKDMMGTTLRRMESHHNSLKLKETCDVWIMCIHQASIKLQESTGTCSVILLNENPSQQRAKCQLSRTNVDCVMERSHDLDTLKTFNQQLQKLISNYQKISY